MKKSLLRLETLTFNYENLMQQLQGKNNKSSLLSILLLLIYPIRTERGQQIKVMAAEQEKVLFVTIFFDSI